MFVHLPAVGFPASRSSGYSKRTVLIGRTGFDATTSDTKPDIEVKKRGFEMLWMMWQAISARP